MTGASKCSRCGAALLGRGVLAGSCAACLFDEGSSPRAGGASFSPPAPEALADAFPGLTIEELVGVGGMGAVYRAVHSSLGRSVALKILPPELAEDPTFAERFAREARTLARLDHPGVVTVHDSGVAGGFYYLVMEFVDGVTLRQLGRDEPVEPAEALEIVRQICDALQYAHGRGVVHRDIKPDNVLVDREGRVRITDFGLAKIFDRPRTDLTLTATGGVVGTPHYMAPEQLERPADVDHRADIYSVGVVFYELLTGDLPIGRFETPSTRVAIDVRLDDVVLRALERRPERRYQRAGELGSDVERITRDPCPAAAAPAEAPSEPAHGDPDARAARGRFRWAVGLAAFATTFLGLAATGRLWSSGLAGVIVGGLLVGAAWWGIGRYVRARTSIRSASRWQRSLWPVGVVGLATAAVVTTFLAASMIADRGRGFVADREEALDAASWKIPLEMLAPEVAGAVVPRLTGWTDGVPGWFAWALPILAWWLWLAVALQVVEGRGMRPWQKARVVLLLHVATWLGVEAWIVTPWVLDTQWEKTEYGFMLPTGGTTYRGFEEPPMRLDATVSELEARLEAWRVERGYALGSSVDGRFEIDERPRGAFRRVALEPRRPYRRWRFDFARTSLREPFLLVEIVTLDDDGRGAPDTEAGERTEGGTVARVRANWYAEHEDVRVWQRTVDALRRHLAGVPAP